MRGEPSITSQLPAPQPLYGQRWPVHRRGCVLISSSSAVLEETKDLALSLPALDSKSKPDCPGASRLTLAESKPTEAVLSD